jgi:hypothetical protein
MSTRRRFVTTLGSLAAGPGLLGACTDSATVFGTANVAGGMVRVASAAGDRLVFITSQWERRRFASVGRSSSGRSVQHLHLDFWAFDAATAQPTQRLRLGTGKELGDVATLGVDRGVLWARLPELIGVRLADGVVVADRERLAAANPALASWLPQPQRQTFVTDQQQRLRFTPAHGLVILLDDGRRVQIDPLTLLARPLNEGPGGNVQAAERLQPRSPMYGNQWNAMVRGLPLGARFGATSGSPTEWLGLVAEREVEAIKSSGYASPSPDFNQQDRFKLYRGLVKPERSFLGLSQKLKLVAPLAEAPEFLFAGLAVQAPDADPPSAMWRRDPDSVYVFHRDRLGDEGRWLLSRVAGPAGRVVWQLALPLSNLGLWWPGARHAVLAGPWLKAPRSPMAEEREGPPLQIVSVDLESGAMASFNLDTGRNHPASARVVPG